MNTETKSPQRRATQARIADIDFIKLGAMFIVIWGHALQYGTTEAPSQTYLHPMSQWVTSFHMPLFMLLSGLFASSALKKSFGVMLKDKLVYLLLPSIIWTGIEVALISLRNPSHWATHSIIGHFVVNYWFIKALILCYVIYYLSGRFLGNNIWTALLTSILTAILPWGNLFNLSTMLPFFWIGVLFKDQILNMPACKIALPSTIVFILLYLLWNIEYTMYSTKIELLRGLPSGLMQIDMTNLGIYIYRLAIGLAGSLSFISLSKLFYIHVLSGTRLGAIFTRWGQHTMGIYMVHVMLLVALSQIYQYPADINVYLFDFILCPINNVIVLLLSVMMIELSTYTPSWVGLVLFGKKPPRL